MNIYKQLVATPVNTLVIFLTLSLLVDALAMTPGMNAIDANKKEGNIEFEFHSVDKELVSYQLVEQMCHQLHEKIKKTGFMPDLIIGMARGGLIPLAILAGEQCFDIRHTLSVSVASYEGDKQGSLKLQMPFSAESIRGYRSILVVDDIVDSGETLEFVTRLVKQAAQDYAVIKTAALYYKSRSKIKPDFYQINTNDWVVFPWEKQPENPVETRIGSDGRKFGTFYN